MSQPEKLIPVFKPLSGRIDQADNGFFVQSEVCSGDFVRFEKPLGLAAIKKEGK